MPKFEKDKQYFLRLHHEVKYDWNKKIVLYLGFLCVVIAMLLYAFTKFLSVWETGILFLAGWMIIYFAVRWIRKNKKEKKARPHDFNPISLGTLYFSFALPLWTTWADEKNGTVPINDWRAFGIGTLAAVISLVFLIAVLNKKILNFVNTKIAPYLIMLTFIAFVFGFVLGWLPTFGHLSGVLLAIVVFFGFAWIVVILLKMVDELKNKLGSTILIVALTILSIIRFIKYDMVNLIGGGILIIIAALAYFVATGYIHLYGEVFEE